MNKLKDAITAIQGDVSYLKTRETQKEIVRDIEIKAAEKAEKIVEAKAHSETQIKTEKNKNWFSKSMTFLKTVIDGVSGVYKVLLVATILLILILLGMHIITWNDVTQLIGIKLFQ